MSHCWGEKKINFLLLHVHNIMALIRNFNDREKQADSDNKKTLRNKSDYAWILCFFALYWLAGDYFFPQRSTEEVTSDISIITSQLYYYNIAAHGVMDRKSCMGPESSLPLNSLYICSVFRFPRF
jgi:hypothetical protein